MFTSDKPIGVFDSGLGGLTVARAIVSAMPDESLCYVGDTKRCPYGPRAQEEVRLFVRQVGAWLERGDVKLMVIACNTATAAGLAALQRSFDIPVIAVIEPGARSIQTYGNVKRLAADLGIYKVSVVANKIRSKSDEEFIRERIPEDALLGFIHFNEEVIDADRNGLSPYDVSAGALEEIRRIKEKIDSRS